MERRYFQLGDFSSNLAFPDPESALAALREVLLALPIRAFVPDSSGVDPWNEAVLMSSSEQVIERLSTLLHAEARKVREELHTRAKVDYLISSAEVHPDALHMVTRLRPLHGRDESIVYGARIQRVAPSEFALWSDY